VSGCRPWWCAIPEQHATPHRCICSCFVAEMRAAIENTEIFPRSDTCVELPEWVCCPWRCAMPAQHAKCTGQAQHATSPKKNHVTSTSPVGDISVVTLIRTDTTLDHSQKAEKVCSRSASYLLRSCQRVTARPRERPTALRACPSSATVAHPDGWACTKTTTSCLAQRGCALIDGGVEWPTNLPKHMPEGAGARPTPRVYACVCVKPRSFIPDAYGVALIDGLKARARNHMSCLLLKAHTHACRSGGRGALKQNGETAPRYWRMVQDHAHGRGG